MKKILSTGYSETAFNIGLFALRLVPAMLLCLNYGIAKLTHFTELKQSFFDPLHVGHRWSLVLTIIAEIVAAMLLVFGLFTRIAAFILVIEMSVIVFMFQHGSEPFSRKENALLFLVCFFTVLMVGPGRYSVDAMAGK